MSEYDKLTIEKNSHLSKLVLVNVGIGATASILLHLNGFWLSRNLGLMLSIVLFALMLSLATHFCLVNVSTRYKVKYFRIKELNRERRILAERMIALERQFPFRKKSQRFKTTFELNNKSLEDMEMRLGVGMRREGKEVFVTAFMKNGISRRVTASIGSAFRCSNSDNPRNWNRYIEEFGCDEILQYHNHPILNNRTEPSQQDFRTEMEIKSILGSNSSKLRSQIIYWNKIGEWRILEYDEKRNIRLVRVFDVSKDSVPVKVS